MALPWFYFWPLAIFAGVLAGIVSVVVTTLAERWLERRRDAAEMAELEKEFPPAQAAAEAIRKLGEAFNAPLPRQRKSEGEDRGA